MYHGAGDCGSFLACNDYRGRFDDSFPACVCVFKKKKIFYGDRLARTNATILLGLGISPQWPLSE